MALDRKLDERYLTWLHRQLEPTTQRNPARSHWILLSHLHQKEFVWWVNNDDNRFFDGLDIRTEFVDTSEGGNVPGYWFSAPCSFLEMLIALARRMAFQSNEEPDYWFWRMMENLNLRIFVDETFEDDAVRVKVNDALNRVIDRSYHADGNGGLFPLRHPGKDQRQVELWYQMSHYLMENINV